MKNMALKLGLLAAFTSALATYWSVSAPAAASTTPTAPELNRRSSNRGTSEIFDSALKVPVAAATAAEVANNITISVSAFPATMLGTVLGDDILGFDTKFSNTANEINFNTNPMTAWQESASAWFMGGGAFKPAAVTQFQMKNGMIARMNGAPNFNPQLTLSA